MNDHDLRLERERVWYQDQFDERHILNRWPFWSNERNESAYAVAKKALVARASISVRPPRNVLVAPCGTWNDLPFLRSIWPGAKYVGLDVAPVAAPSEETHVGDVLNMPFGFGSFDVVVATLFFHHVADEGFSDYLIEYRRVLAAHGVLIAMEQSIFHPVFLLTRPLKRIVGNITGQVDHEHPISIHRLAKACYDAGFRKVATFACSFAHQRVPTPLRTVINATLLPVRRWPVVKHLAWQMGLIAWK